MSTGLTSQPTNASEMSHLSPISNEGQLQDEPNGFMDFGVQLQQAIAEQTISSRVSQVENSVTELRRLIFDNPVQMPGHQLIMDAINRQGTSIVNRVNTLLQKVAQEMASIVVRQNQILAKVATSASTGSQQQSGELCRPSLRDVAVQVDLAAAGKKSQGESCSEMQTGEDMASDNRGNLGSDRGPSELQIDCSQESLCSRFLDCTDSQDEIPEGHDDTNDVFLYQGQQNSAVRDATYKVGGSSSKRRSSKRARSPASDDAAGSCWKKLIVANLRRASVSTKTRQPDATIRKPRVQADFVEQAMGTKKIAERIFEFLSKDDLLQCSLVCRKLNHFAREVLQKKKRCELYINFDGDSYDEFEKLTEILHSSKCLPFWGISVTCSHNITKRNAETGKWKEQLWKKFERVVVDKLTNLRCIKVDYNAGCDKVAAVGIESVCKKVSERLEVLIFCGNVPMASSTLLCKKNPLSNLNRLMVFGIPNYPSLDLELKIVTIVARAAPNLRKFIGLPEPRWIEYPIFQELDSRDLITGVNLWYHKKWKTQCKSFEEYKFSLEEVNLSYDEQHNSGCPDMKEWENEGSATRIALKLLRSSYLSLKTLVISLPDLQAIYAGGKLPECDNLEILRLCFRLEDSNRLLRNVDLGSAFPNVEVCTLYYGRWTKLTVQNTFETLGGNVGRLDSVTYLHLVREGTMPVVAKEITAVIQSFARMFPNVKHFYASHHSPPQIRSVMEALWLVWPDLESINFSDIRLSQLRSSFDSTICGIPAERVKNLRDRGRRGKNAGFCTLPSISDKRNLQILRLEIVHDVPVKKNVGEQTFSWLSGAVGFGRMTDFSIELYRLGVFKPKIHNLFDLSHLEPYVRIKTRNRALLNELNPKAHHVV